MGQIDKIPWLNCTIDDQDIYYSLDEMIKNFEVKKLTSDGYIVLNWCEDKSWLKFAVLDFGYSDSDGSNQMLKTEFYGEGPSGHLRECRHTWWGNNHDGYVFYPNGELISAAMSELKLYFDMD